VLTPFRQALHRGPQDGVTIVAHHLLVRFVRPRGRDGRDQLELRIGVDPNRGLLLQHPPHLALRRGDEPAGDGAWLTDRVGVA